MTRTNLLALFLLLSSNCLGNEYGAEKQLLTQVRALQHTIANQDSEIAYIKEKLLSFETILNSTHDEMSKLITEAKSTVKKSSGSVDSRMQVIEKNNEKIVSDLKTFKKQSNELSKLLGELQTSLKEKEERLSLQAEQTKELELAMRLLTQALQPKSTAANSNYQVKPGDTLDKIAKEFNTTVASIKAENNLQKDTIHPGQKLKIS